MRVLSWDVGIINLAYCLIEVDDKTKDWKIIDWGLINLTNRDKIKCFQCGLNPSFFQQKLSDNKIIYTCKRHAKNVDTCIPVFDDIFKLVNDDNICFFEGKNKCTKKAKYKIDDLYFCNTHAKGHYKKMESSFQLKKYNRKSVAGTSLDEIRYKLICELDNRKNLFSADKVLIENQPTLKNPRMKSISSTVYDYYLIRGIIDKEINNSSIKSVKYMSPSNKLKLADDGDTSKLIKLKGDEAKTYKLTKALGIKYCYAMIKPFPEWTGLLDSAKKKDDLADAFLQGMYVITTNL